MTRAGMSIRLAKSPRRSREHRQERMLQIYHVVSDIAHAIQINAVRTTGS